MHSSEAISPYCMNGSVLLISFLSKKFSISASTVAAKVVSKLDTSNLVIGLAPLLPSSIFFQESETLFPTGESIPRPVITTLL